jgi:pyruvate-formate lyase-activating enzyme
LIKHVIVMSSSDKPAFNLDIDIVGTCNLRCPSCPVGNSPELRTRSGIMPRDLLEAILDKALAECQLSFVSLFNWTEPFLHPRLADMIRAVRSRGLPCALSSNLNVTADFCSVLRADPTLLRVSLSGFRQEIYGKTHRHGNIERVKQNMREVAQAKRLTGSDIDLHVLFHRYLGNHEDEFQMRAFAESLGFQFQPVWAYLMPLEKNLAFLGESDTGTSITSGDRTLIESLALRPDEASQAARPYRDQPCVLQTRRLAIDHEGKIQLCCATFDRARYTVADFLKTPLSEIQQRRRDHSLCATCAKHGLHIVAVYGAPEFEQVARDRVRAAFPDLELPPSYAAPAAKKPKPPKKPRDTGVVKLLKKLADWPSRVYRKRIRKRAA